MAKKRCTIKQAIKHDPATRRDPLHLPFDIISLIFGQLRMLDIIACQRVNRGWHGFIQEWMSLSRRFHPHKLSPFWPNFKENELAVSHAANSALRMRLGRASDCPIFSGSPIDRINGDYAVGFEYTRNDKDIKYLDQITWTMRLLWRGIYPEAPVREIPIRHLVQGQEIGSHRRLLLNEDGTVAVLLDVGGCFQLFVYSPKKKRLLCQYHWWSKDHVHPFELGKDLLYCIIKKGNLFELAAFDFRRQQHVYSIKDPSWLCLDGDRHGDPYFETYTQMFTVEGDEFILITTPFRPDYAPIYYTLHIIRGSDGEKILSMNYPAQIIWRARPLYDPTTRQIAIIWDSARHPAFSLRDYPALSPYRLSLARTFTYTNGTASPLSPAMVVLHEGGEHHCEALHPFTMTALGYTSDMDSPITVRDVVQVPTFNTKLYTGAQTAVNILFPDDGVKVAGCYTLSPPKRVIAPSRSGRMTRRVQTKENNGMQWASYSRLRGGPMFENEESYVVDF